MKKYPYTESTDLIIYDQKPKKEKTKVWLTAVCSALCCKHIYSRCIRNRNVLYAKNMNNNTQSAAVASATTQSDDSSSSDSAQLAAYKNGKKVLTIPEIAEQVRTKFCRCYKQDYSSTAKILRSVQRKILLFKRRRKHRRSNR